MTARYDSDGERIDRPTRSEAAADALALGDFEQSVTAEQVAEYVAALNAHVAQADAAALGDLDGAA